MKYRMTLECDVPTAVRWDDATVELTAVQRAAVTDICGHIRDYGRVIGLTCEPIEGAIFPVQYEEED